MVHAWVLGSDANPSANRNARVEHRNNRLPDGRAEGRSGAQARRRSWRTARLIFLAGAFLLLFAGFSFMRSYADAPAPRAAAPNEKVVTTDTGDTLWGIAQAYKRQGLDTREAVYRIMERNGLVSSNIDSGRRLIIPANVLPK